MAYNRYGKPTPNKQYTINFPTLDGGLNIYDLDYRLKNTESPHMRNLHWKDGALGCRPGQAWTVPPKRDASFLAEEDKTAYQLPIVAYAVLKVLVYEEAEDGKWKFVEKHAPDDYSYSSGTVTFTSAPPVPPEGTTTSIIITYQVENVTGYAAYDDLFWDYCFVHVGGELRCYNPADVSPTYTVLHTGVPQKRGTFFRYQDNLLYKNPGGYYQIGYSPDGTTVATMFPTKALGEDGFAAEVPIILINTDPETHAGDLYQPENRLSPDKEVWYNIKQDVASYRLPVPASAIVSVTVKGAAQTEGTDYEFTTNTDVVTFKSGHIPTPSTPAANNEVKIVYTASNTDAYDSLMDCPYAIVYGGDQNLCIVFGGCPAQPNAYFWNDRDELVMRPTYFPMEHYNFAGDTESMITGFGKQQGLLVIFSTKGVGKATFGTTTTTTDRLQIEMPYTAINSRIGCDYPWSIQLVENNLVFCNRDHGVCILLDSSAALENNIEHISTKVNGNPARPGLLHDIEEAGYNAVYSTINEDEYWLVANGNAYVWDFELSRYNDPSWFLYTGIRGIAYTRHADDLYHLSEDGSASKFNNSFGDYGESIDKVFRFPVQNMGTYDSLKDVVSMLFVVRSDTDTEIEIEYQTDYERRIDLTPIKSYSWSLVPRNLAYRFLGVQKYAHVERRRPYCRHVRHFTAELRNSIAGEDLSVVSAQIFYNFQGRQR